MPGQSSASNARDDLQNLLNGAVEVAAELLEAEGEFEPFALGLGQEGDLIQLSPEGHEEELDPVVLIEGLKRSLKEGAARGKYVAVCIVTDVTIEDEDDEAISSAVSISMEHLTGESMLCFIPYEVGTDGRVEFSELVGEAGDLSIFGTGMLN